MVRSLAARRRTTAIVAALGLGGGVTPGYVFANAEAAAFAARVAPAPSDARKAVIDTFVGLLKVGGINGTDTWTVADLIQYLPFALLNIKSASFTPTLGAGALVVPGQGVYCDGIDDYIDWGWAPSNGVNYTLNSASIFAFMMKPDRDYTTSLPDFGTATGTAAVQFNARGTTNLTSSRLNSATSTAGTVTITSGYGLQGTVRTGANATQDYKTGAAINAPGTGASSSLSAININSGRVAGLFTENQFICHYAGAALSANQVADLNFAVAYANTALGIAEASTVVATRTIAQTSTQTLPDGSNPNAPGDGMPNTGLVRDPIDGTWWIGWGIASFVALAGVTHVSADFTTVLGEYNVTSWGLSATYNGSVQGVAFDTADNTLYLILKTSTQGYLVHIDRAGALLSAPVLLASNAVNGLAYDSRRDCLILFSTTTIPIISWISKAGASLNATYPPKYVTETGDGDQLWFDVATNDILLTEGANGVAGSVIRYSQERYGGYAIKARDILTGADAIEGVVVYGGFYVTMNDNSTHPGATSKNRVARHAS